MTGRAPFQGRVLRPADRSPRGGVQFGDAVLGERQRETGGIGKSGVVGFDGRQRIGVGREAVHQQERQGSAAGFAQEPDLADDDVEEAVAVLGDHERFGLFQAHAGAESPVQLDQDRPGHGVSGRGVGLVQFFQRGQRAQVAQRGAGYGSEISLVPAADIPEKGLDYQGGGAIGSHAGADFGFGGSGSHGAASEPSFGSKASMAWRSSARSSSRRAVRT